LAAELVRLWFELDESCFLRLGAEEERALEEEVVEEEEEGARLRGSR